MRRWRVRGGRLPHFISPHFLYLEWVSPGILAPRGNAQMQMMTWCGEMKLLRIRSASFWTPLWSNYDVREGHFKGQRIPLEWSADIRSFWMLGKVLSLPNNQCIIKSDHLKGHPHCKVNFHWTNGSYNRVTLQWQNNGYRQPVITLLIKCHIAFRGRFCMGKPNQKQYNIFHCLLWT